MKIDKKEYLQSFIDSIRDEKNEIEKEYKKIILEENKNLIKRYKKEV